MPHEGPNIYPIGVVKPLIDDNTFLPMDCKWGVTATRSIHPLDFRKSVTTFQDCIEEVAGDEHILRELLLEFSKPDDISFDDWPKVLIQKQRNGYALKMIGVFNQYFRRQHTIHLTNFEGDMKSKQISAITQGGQKIPQMRHTTAIVHNVTYAPFSIIALDADIMDLREIKALLNKSMDIHKIHLTIISRCVDCIYFTSSTSNKCELRDLIENEKLRYSGLSRCKLQILKNPKSKVHLGEQPF